MSLGRPYKDEVKGLHGLGRRGAHACTRIFPSRGLEGRGSAVPWRAPPAGLPCGLESPTRSEGGGGGLQYLAPPAGLPCGLGSPSGGRCLAPTSAAPLGSPKHPSPRRRPRKRSEDQVSLKAPRQATGRAPESTAETAFDFSSTVHSRRLSTLVYHSAHGVSNIPPNIRRTFPAGGLPLAGRQSNPGLATDPSPEKAFDYVSTVNDNFQTEKKPIP
eukprot:1189720-Prorocentrum_minimum.AAC.2